MRMQMGRAYTIAQPRMCASVLYARARACRRSADVPGAAAGMQGLCGAYSVAVGMMAQELVAACGACQGSGLRSRLGSAGKTCRLFTAIDVLAQVHKVWLKKRHIFPVGVHRTIQVDNDSSHV